MTTQTEMFPKTELDQAHVVLTHLVNEEEKAETALDNAERKLSEAQSRVYKQRQVISWLQAKMPASDPAPMEGEASEEAEDAEIVDEAHQIEGDVVDPITGEVTGKSDVASDGAETCAEEPVVIALYPTDGDGHPGHQTPIGDRTRYGELVADYLTAEGLDESIEDYEVMGMDGVEGAIAPRDLANIIGEQDYGHRPVVRLREEAAAERLEALTEEPAA